MKTKIFISNIIYIFYSLIFFIFTQESLSQQNSFLLKGKEYRFITDKWYSFFNGVQGSELDPTRLIVRLKNRGKVEDLNFSNMNLDGVASCSDRFLSGYYVSKIPPTLNPFASARRLEQTNLFDVLEFDLICELTANPNDQYFPNQWNLTKLGMPIAWDIS